MAATITHTTVAAGTDAGNGEIRKAQWNEAHTITGTLDVANGGTGAATARAAAAALSVPYVFAQSSAAVTAGAVVTEEVLATITVPGGAVGPNGQVQIWASYSFTASTNNKTPRIRVGGVSGTLVFNQTYALTTQANVARMVLLANVNSQSSQKTYAPLAGNGLGALSSDIVTASVDTSVNWDIVLSGVKGSAGENLTLNAYQVIICYGA